MRDADTGSTIISGPPSAKSNPFNNGTNVCAILLLANRCAFAAPESLTRTDYNSVSGAADMVIQWRAWEAEPQFGVRTYRGCAANPTLSGPKQDYLIRFSASLSPSFPLGGKKLAPLVAKATNRISADSWHTVQNLQVLYLRPLLRGSPSTRLSGMHSEVQSTFNSVSSPSSLNTIALIAFCHMCAKFCLI